MRTTPSFTLTRTGPWGDAMNTTYTLTFAALPDQSWTYSYHEMWRELMVSADLTAVEARSALLDAYLEGPR